MLRKGWKQAGKMHYIYLFEQADTQINTYIICIGNSAHVYEIGLSFAGIVLLFCRRLESRTVLQWYFCEF